MKISVNIYKLLLILILLFVPINLLKDLFPIPLTLITGGIILILMIAILLTRLKKKQFILMILPIAIFALNFAFTDNISRHVRYFLNWYALLCTLLMCSDSDILKKFCNAYYKSERSIHRLTQLVALIFVVLLIMPAAYSGGWWGLSNGFTAFTVSHAVAASACGFLVYELIYLQNHQRKLPMLEGMLYVLLSVYVVFQTGARTYVISIAAIALIYLFDIIKSRKIRISIIVIGLIFVTVIFSKSAFIEKMAITESYQTVNNVSFLNAITSGRTLIWTVDFLSYIHSGLYTLFFGKGFAFSYEINRLKYFGLDIFSHNIFLETLLSEGFIGLTILLNLMIKMIKKFKIDKISLVASMMYVPLIGFLNGLFDSQIYCYSILILGIAFYNKINICSRYN